MVKLMKPVRTAEDWVILGLQVLAERGPSAIRVEPMAVALKVTKGSFYWHFEDRRALERAMLARWEQLATDEVITFTDAPGGTPADRLRRLLELTMTHSSAPFLEQAIRSWGATDKTVSRVLARVDERRQAYVRGLFVEHGLTPAAATSRARFLYLALIGEYVWVSHGGEPTSEKAREDLMELVLRPSRPSGR
jgi:AcrR family transcriptional regulator